MHLGLIVLMAILPLSIVAVFLVMLRCPAKYAMLLAHAVAVAVAIGFWGTRKLPKT